jgi:hypothetical protein
MTESVGFAGVVDEMPSFCANVYPMPKAKNFKPRSRNRFRETELARAVRAAKDAGGERVEIDPQSGKISVILAKPGESENKDTPERIISKL